MLDAFLKWDIQDFPEIRFFFRELDSPDPE